jgi:hypothetical protein
MMDSTFNMQNKKRRDVSILIVGSYFATAINESRGSETEFARNYKILKE